MKLSVIIPNYNNDKFIENCLNSLYNQTYKDFEIIIIDDGSSDNSLEVIENFINTNKLDIRLIKQYNQNASIARNKGIEICRGEYIYFLDSDDEVYSNEIIETIIDKIGDNDLLIGNYVVIDENGKFLYNYYNENEIVEFHGNNKYCNLSPVPSNKLYKTKIIRDYNLYFSNVRIGQDLNFYLKYLAVCNKVKIIDDVIYKYRIVNSGISKSKNLNFLDIRNSILEIKNYYIKNNKYSEFEMYITPIAIKHYHNQLVKVINFKDYKTKKMIYSYFSYCISEIKVQKKYKNEVYKKEYNIYIFKLFLLKIGLYNFIKRIKDKTKNR